jgi:bifunctional non-homologous end joining protein LigD
MEPQLAELTREAPSSDSWLHEVKFDGYRMRVRISRDSVRLISRHGRDWSKPFQAIAEAAGKIKCENAWIDGELCAIDAKGRVSFQDLQNAVRSRVPARLMFYAFDLPYLDGWDLRGCTLTQRKRLLERLLKGGPDSICYVRPWEGDGRDYYAEACRMKIEGIVSKRKDSRYVAGRSSSWRKVKCETREQLVIAGFTRTGSSRFSSLLLGYYDDAGKLHYAGRVKMGWNRTTEEILGGALASLRRKTPPYADPPAKEGTIWVTPKLVAEVAYLERTKDGALRHASFKGLCISSPGDIKLTQPKGPDRS